MTGGALACVLIAVRARLDHDAVPEDDARTDEERAADKAAVTVTRVD